MSNELEHWRIPLSAVTVWTTDSGGYGTMPERARTGASCRRVSLTRSSSPSAVDAEGQTMLILQRIIAVRGVPSVWDKVNDDGATG